MKLNMLPLLMEQAGGGGGAGDLGIGQNEQRAHSGVGWDECWTLL